MAKVVVLFDDGGEQHRQSIDRWKGRFVGGWKRVEISPPLQLRRAGKTKR
jgi:hypothetical protein